MNHDAIAVVDFGGQYAHLIATKVRLVGVHAEIRQPEDPIEAFAPYQGLILSGSPSLSSRGEDAAYTKAIFDLDVPILGFCFGHQEIAKHYGGTVEHGGREWGPADLHVTRAHPLFHGVDTVSRVWMSHYDSVVSVGPEFDELGYSLSTEGAPDHRFAAIGSDALGRYGFQFHPEVDDTVGGDEMIANFVLEICGCRPTWDMSAYLDTVSERLRDQIADRSVFMLASGGVDSTVAAALLREVVGAERLRLLHIDNGLMRKNESREVMATFRDLELAPSLHFVDASDDFLAALDGLTDPEEKRRAIGNAFVRVFEREAESLGIQDHLLGQGTIYPDTIETGGTKRADTIKTHHNRVPVIEEMISAGRVVEPLADLYKVEVRELGRRLGLNQDLIGRHPFPGPGLGVRLLCRAPLGRDTDSSDGADQSSDGADQVEDALDHDAREAQAITPVVEALAAPVGLQATVLPIRSVGVKADLRAYEHPVLLTGDAPWSTLIEAASTITAEAPGVNRCVWNLGPRPGRARALARFVTHERLETLREADRIVMAGLQRYSLYDVVWQCPTVLVPVDLYGGDHETVILRPVRSQRAMTASPVELPDALLGELRDLLLDLPGVSGLAIDVTSKPPGTIEWE